MKKQPEITDATREAFVNAFFQLAQKKSINQITIREITDLAGYNRTTFYRYFEDVFSLIEYAEDDFLQRTQNALKEQRRERTVGEREFFETLIYCLHENADRISVLVSEQNRSHFMRRFKENMPDNLYAQTENTPKKKVIKDIYFYGIFHAISINLQNQNALPDEDLLDLIQKLFDRWYWPAMREDACCPVPNQ
ncbi:MAG: TetR/AcrR family transcriptional regulator [Clostridiaceae bacterium]|nr:TetR/AcrR family transcriptional regulator [Clostridiaceae bacterium]